MRHAIRKLAAWKPEAAAIRLRASAEELSDVRPLLTSLIDSLGTNGAARLLDADRAQVSRWAARKSPISSEMSRRIVDLHDILSRAVRIMGFENTAQWLTGSEPLLGGARPIDVIAIEGAAPIIRALDGIAQGAYA